MALLQVCCAPGCDDIAMQGRPHCEVHAAARDQAKRDHRARAKLSADALAGSALYADPAWKRLRVAFLRANPLCLDCDRVGLPVTASEVDHITPHRGDRALFFDRSNLQGLCKPCHSRKTMGEVNGRRKVGGGVRK